jgi:hypothetical protein
VRNWLCHRISGLFAANHLLWPVLSDLDDVWRESEGARETFHRCHMSWFLNSMVVANSSSFHCHECILLPAMFQASLPQRIPCFTTESILPHGAWSSSP